MKIYLLCQKNLIHNSIGTIYGYTRRRIDAMAWEAVDTRYRHIEEVEDLTLKLEIEDGHG